MKTIYKYNKDLEIFLMTLDENQFHEWLKTNQIEYERTLLEVILADKALDQTI